MIHRSREGARLWKQITIRTFMPENRFSRVRTFKAQPGMGYTEAEVDKFLQAVSEEIEKRFPEHDYNLVELTEGRFNFVWRGRREAGASQQGVSA